MLSSVMVCQFASVLMLDGSVDFSSLSETVTCCQSGEPVSGLVTVYSAAGLSGVNAPHALQVRVIASWLSASHRTSKARMALSGPCHFGSLSLRVVAVQRGGWAQFRRYQSCHSRVPSSMVRSG